jgi:heme-degrading monooxygenase HmoA
MTVTEFAFLPTREGIPTSVVTDITRKALEIQDAWCADNVPHMPLGARARGALFLQQIEDPSVMLLTAHWDSVAQHHDWIASEPNKGALGMLSGNLALDRVVFFHVDKTASFAASKEAGKISTLESPIISVTRILVAKANKTEFEQTFETSRPEYDLLVSPFEHHAGWRVEKEPGWEDLDEFVIVGGWESLDSSAKIRGLDSYKATISQVALQETTHYRVLL